MLIETIHVKTFLMFFYKSLKNIFLFFYFILFFMLFILKYFLCFLMLCFFVLVKT